MQKASTLPATNEAIALLTKALTDGHSITLSLAAAPRVIREPPLVTTCCLTLGLTPSQARVLVALLEHGYVSRPDLHEAMSHDSKTASKIKIIDVVVCKIRQKLPDIEIITVWGEGYRLDDNDRDKLRKILAPSSHPNSSPAMDFTAP